MDKLVDEIEGSKQVENLILSLPKQQNLGADFVRLVEQDDQGRDKKTVQESQCEAS